jgi:hypothetical protein
VATVAPIRTGDEFAAPPFRLSRQRLIMCSAASRDFAPAHIMSDAARREGAPDAYADLTFAFAIAERLVLHWAGPTAWIRAIGPLRIADFVVADQDVLSRGRVVDVTRAEPGGRPGWDVDAEIELAQSDGRVPITGRLRVRVPDEEDE